MDPHPVIVTIMDNRDYIRVLLYSDYTTITGWGVLLRYSLKECGTSFAVLNIAVLVKMLARL